VLKVLVLVNVISHPG